MKIALRRNHLSSDFEKLREFFTVYIHIIALIISSVKNDSQMCAATREIGKTVPFAAVELHPRILILCSTYPLSDAPKIVNFFVQES